MLTSMTGQPRLSAFEYKLLALVRMVADETGENVSLSSLGTRAKLSHATLRKWVKNSYGENFSPDTKSLKKLADYCDVTIDWLLQTGDVPRVAGDGLTIADLYACRERLLTRRYPTDAVNAALLSKEASQASNAEQLFDLAERDLASQGYSARFDRLGTEPSERSEKSGTRVKNRGSVGRTGKSIREKG